MKTLNVFLTAATAAALTAIAAAQPTPPVPPAPATAPRVRPVQRAISVHPGTGAFLGVGVAEIDSDRAKVLKLTEEHGVEVKSVEKESPAEKAGVKNGDVVLQYNGQRVEGVEQFIRFVRETPVGRAVKLNLWRGGQAQTLTATIGTRGDMAAMPEFSGLKVMPEIRIPDLPRAFTSWRSSTLGVESESLGSQLAEYFGVKEGALVRAVTKGSAAEKAGLKAGDVITKVDGDTVSGPREVATKIRGMGSKKTFPMTIVRDKKEMTVNVTLDEDAFHRNHFRVELDDQEL